MTIIANQFVHGGNIYQYSEEQRKGLLDFSANINPLGPSPLGLAALGDWTERIQHYPEPYHVTLRQELGRYYRLAPENIAAGNGATEFLYTLFSHLRPPRVWVVAPTFSEYARAGLAAGARIISKAREDLLRDAQENLRRNDAVCLCLPNNPDGTIPAPEIVAQWMDLTRRRGAYLLLDESFGDFNPEFASYRNSVITNPHVFVLQSLTKFWAIPGLRLGALFAHCEQIENVLAQTDQWNVNVLATQYMTAALQDTAYITATQALIATEKNRVYEMYRSRSDFAVHYPAVNFMLMKLPPHCAASIIADRLAARGILIRNCDNYDGLTSRHIRIAIREPQDNDTLFAALVEEVERLQGGR